MAESKRRFRVSPEASAAGLSCCGAVVSPQVPESTCCSSAWRALIRSAGVNAQAGAMDERLAEQAGVAGGPDRLGVGALLLTTTSGSPVVCMASTGTPPSRPLKTMLRIAPHASRSGAIRGARLRVRRSSARLSPACWYRASTWARLTERWSWRT